MNIVERMLGVTNVTETIEQHYHLTKEKGVSKMQTAVEKYINEFKVCTKCNEIKHLDEYYTYKNGKKRSLCKKCSREYSSKYRKDHPNKCKIYNQRYRSKNKLMISDKNKQYYLDHREERLLYQKKYSIMKGRDKNE